MIRPPFIAEGVHYDLGHLAPSVLLCPRPGPTVADEPHLRIEIAFSHHCYTVNTADDPGAAQVYHVRERGDVRLFNAARWALSRAHLPGMIATLPAAKVEHTWEQRNYRYALTTPLPEGSVYQMFYSLRRSAGAGTDLRMFVESAYPISPASRPRAPGIIRFAILAMKVLRGEPIRHPPRR